MWGGRAAALSPSEALRLLQSWGRRRFLGKKSCGQDFCQEEIRVRCVLGQGGTKLGNDSGAAVPTGRVRPEEVSGFQAASSSRNANASSTGESLNQGSGPRGVSKSASVLAARFHAASAHQFAMGSRLSHGIGAIGDGARMAAPVSSFRARMPTPGSGQLVHRMNYALDTSSRGPRTDFGMLGFGQTSGLSTDAGPGQHAVSNFQSDGGSEKVVARIANTPKFMFKSDLLSLLKGCNLNPEDFVYIYDNKFSIKFVQLQLASMKSFHIAQKSLSAKGRFGGRFLKMTLGEVLPLDGINRMIAPFRGRSLCMVNIPPAVMTEDVGRFFSGYALDHSYPIKIVQTFQSPVGGNHAAAVAAKSDVKPRALVRFKTELEALRALREKQGSFCMETPIDLRFIE